MIRNRVNGNEYIGSTSQQFNRRWNAHRSHLRKGVHHSRYLQRAWTKYGEEAFEFSILAPCLPEDCVVSEQLFLDAYKPKYNICLVADSAFGTKRTEEAKRNMSLAHLGKKMPEETKRKIAEANRGQKRPPEFSKKMSDLRKAYWARRKAGAA